MASTKAYVLDDGEVVSEGYMNKYAVKDGDSKQIPKDVFLNEYGSGGLVEPLYHLEGLAQLLEINPYHYRAVKTKARDTAGIGWFLEPTEDKEKPSEQQKQLALQLLGNPGIDGHFSAMVDKVMVDFEATGNGYAEVMRDSANGNVIGMEHIPSHTIRIHGDGKRYAQQRGLKRVWFKAFGHDKDIDASDGAEHPLGTLDDLDRGNELLHIKNYTSRSDYYGIPDIIPALGAVLGDKERQEYNISFFDNHAVPAYAVTVTGTELDQDVKNTIKNFFQNEVKKERHSTLVLEGKKDPMDPEAEPIKFEFQELSADVKEASFTTFRKDNRDEVLSAHGVPPYRAGITVEGQLGGSSAGESTEIYKQSVIRPRQETVEAAITLQIMQIGLGITDWKFRFESIDTRDVGKEIDIKRKEIQTGIVTPNEAREALGYERVDDPAMDKFYMNGRPLGQPSGGGNPAALMDATKELHRDLLAIAKKGE